MPVGVVKRAQPKLIWHDAQHLQIGATNFLLALDGETADTAQSTAETFLLMKSQSCVETILRHIPEGIDNMVEFGIFKGGSIAFYEELFSPQRLVGVDIEPDRVAALDQYLERRSATSRVRLYYGIDQGDAEALDAIARENFSTEPIDLVVDDGSHRYGPSKTALNRFLPLVRPHGVYLIEDWGWAHWLRHRPESGQYDDEQNPLTKLVFEAVMLAASHEGLIREVIIDSSRAFIVRGRKSMATLGDFDIDDEYRTSLWRFDFAQPVQSAGPFLLSGEESEPTNGSSAQDLPRDGLLHLWRRLAPPSIRTMVPQNVASWVRRHLPRSFPEGPTS
jgi:predicted O-methyltransferase YrrM